MKCTPGEKLPGRCGSRRRRTGWSSSMHSLGLNRADAPLTILCLGAHSDDIEIGCGGAILKMLEQHQRTNVHWIVFSSDQRRADEARASAGRFLKRAESKRVVINKFKNSFFPYMGAD